MLPLFRSKAQELRGRTPLGSTKKFSLRVCLRLSPYGVFGQGWKLEARSTSTFPPIVVELEDLFILLSGQAEKGAVCTTEPGQKVQNGKKKNLERRGQGGPFPVRPPEIRNVLGPTLPVWISRVTDVGRVSLLSMDREEDGKR